MAGRKPHLRKCIDAGVGPVAEARLAKSNVPVWAIVGYLMSTGWDRAAVARDYRISDDEVAAVEAYYQDHRIEIDDRLAANVV